MAAIYHVSLPLTDRQLASASYRVGEFLVTLASLNQALLHGSSSSDDVDLQHLLASSAYNAGVIMSRWGDRRQDGESLLVLSARVSACYHLADSSAVSELRRQLGSPNRWPTPTPSPLLAACPGNKEQGR